MTAPAMPGECHPAYADRADAIRRNGADRDVILVAEFRHLPATVNLSDHPEILDTVVRERVLRRERASFSLFPQYGAYVWDVWVDDLGRQVAGEHARWVENDLAWTLPPFGHGPLQTPEQAAAERRDRAASRDREYLDGLARDYARGLAAFAVLFVLALLIGPFL